MKRVLGTIAALTLSGVVFAGGYQKDIVDTAEKNGNFDTFVSAIAAADFTEKLKSDGPFTVFAPNDEAFSTLPEGVIEEWLKPENKDKLVELLSYHVVSGKISSEDIKNDTDSVENLAGSELSVDLSDGMMINTATVTDADIDATNGVIHVVDKVIIPANWPST